MFSNYGCGNTAHQPGDVDYCSCWQNGYEAGKAKVLHEMENYAPGDHGQSCDCFTCRMARRWLELLLATGAGAE